LVFDFSSNESIREQRSHLPVHVGASAAMNGGAEPMSGTYWLPLIAIESHGIREAFDLIRRQNQTDKKGRPCDRPTVHP
jgi:hypothetical protein